MPRLEHKILVANGAQLAIAVAHEAYDDEAAGSSMPDCRILAVNGSTQLHG
jgi:hypothetical protein